MSSKLSSKLVDLLYNSLPEDLKLNLLQFPSELRNDLINAALPAELNGQLSFEATTTIIDVNVTQTLNSYLVEFDAPGVSKSDIKISIKASTQELFISYERKNACDVETNKALISELSYGKFARTLVLPTDAKTIGVVSSTENGVIRLVFSKNPEEEATEIFIA